MNAHPFHHHIYILFCFSSALSIFIRLDNFYLYFIVMKANLIASKTNYIANKAKKDHLAIHELMNTLKEINFNSSWKKHSTHFNKTKTGITAQSKQAKNNMTEHDVDRLFMKSKQTHKMRTEISFHQNRETEKHLSKEKDLTKTKFLQMEDQYDKYLSGLPSSVKLQDKENNFLANNASSQHDLTLKFKKDFIVGKIIGQGAYALVRVALYKPMNQKIAIKAYEKTKIKQPARKKTVRREIKILQTLNHPNIVKIIDVVQTNNHLNIVMEYLPGISLGTSLKQQAGQRFAQGDCKSIIKKIADALRYIHSKNIAHRDIKLENIILDDSCSPKLIDFGFSTCIEKNTKIKIFCGTPSYMAPEIVQKTQYRGESADIWALGVMMYVMLIGYFPYRANTDEQLFRKINSADFPKHDIVNLKKAYSLISRMFTINPADRIDANGVLNHPWLNEQKESQSLIPKAYSQMPELTKLKSNSIQRVKQKTISTPKSMVNNSKKSYNIMNFKNMTKNIKQLNKTIVNRTLKIQKASAPIRKQSTSNSVKKPKIEPKYNILDMFKYEIKRKSTEKSKCKSHRN